MQQLTGVIDQGLKASQFDVKGEVERISRNQLLESNTYVQNNSSNFNRLQEDTPSH